MSSSSKSSRLTMLRPSSEQLSASEKKLGLSEAQSYGLYSSHLNSSHLGSLHLAFILQGVEIPFTQFQNCSCWCVKKNPKVTCPTSSCLLTWVFLHRNTFPWKQGRLHDKYWEKFLSPGTPKQNWIGAGFSLFILKNMLFLTLILANLSLQGSYTIVYLNVYF